MKSLLAFWTAAWLVLAVGIGLPAGAQQDGDTPLDNKNTLNNQAVADHPGFFDFGKLDAFTRDDLDIHISVKGPMLQLVAAASRDAEPDLADTLGRLQGIEVLVYNLAENRRQKAREVVDQTAEALTKVGWQPAITVQVQRDHGYAFLRYEKQTPIGLAAMYITDENQAVMVNIVGSMDMATIGRLARRFDLDLLAVTEDSDAQGDGGSGSSEKKAPEEKP